MKKLAIIIAVSEYRNSGNNLPACKNDGEAIRTILNKSGKFDDILILSENTNAGPVKRSLSEFTEKHKEDEISEIFFYFTGHGSFSSGEFYYVMSDFQEAKRSQTSLENSELDGMIRALNPHTFVKVVDACHSGVSYIKSSEDMSEYIKSFSGAFQKLYFMFSSQSNQFSYQDQSISTFTESFIASIYNFEGDGIRYKDIISYISDDFHKNDRQTPLFVVQADYTEVFLNISDDLKYSIEPFMREEEKSFGNLVADGKSEVQSSLLAKVKADAERYCTKEDATTRIVSLYEYFKFYEFNDDIRSIYNVEILDAHEAPPQPAAIGRWADESKGAGGYFIRKTTRSEVYQKRVPKDPLKAFSSFFSSETDYTYVDAKREVVDGFRFTTDVPFNHIVIRLNPAYPNVSSEECYIVPILSRINLRVFWGFSHFEYLDWEKSARSGKIEWKTEEIALKDADAISKLSNDILTEFVNFVEEPLRAKLDTGGTPQ